MWSLFFAIARLHETVGYLCDFMPSSNISLPISIDYLRELTMSCTHNIRFNFLDSAYRQIDAMTTGRPLDPTIAAGLLSIKEMKLNDCFIVDIPIFTDSRNFRNILKRFNFAHPNLSVSYEKEANDSLDFPRHQAHEAI